MIDLRHATEKDIPAIVALLEELDQHYGVTEFPSQEEREQQVRQVLFGPMRAARVLLAQDGPDVVGLASYSHLWPAAGVTASLYLKELYIRKAYRQRGIGRLLMAEICSIAHESGCSRVEWTTDRDNADAQAFYRQIGAPTRAKIMYRLEGTDINRMKS